MDGNNLNQLTRALQNRFNKSKFKPFFNSFVHPSELNELELYQAFIVFRHYSNLFLDIVDFTNNVTRKWDKRRLDKLDKNDSKNTFVAINRCLIECFYCANSRLDEYRAAYLIHVHNVGLFHNLPWKKQGHFVSGTPDEYAQTFITGLSLPPQDQVEVQARFNSVNAFISVIDSAVILLSDLGHISQLNGADNRKIRDFSYQLTMLGRAVREEQDALNEEIAKGYTHNRVLGYHTLNK
ncbi:hypothetical protein [Catenovulum agarivorans]|uniref:hypothetical protein n=1 Tax=Catenovulum agarivorans TaxID=1172192 RepID=UPI000309A478|nr:hypothetical protein [Catenovulum agarivorans]